MSELGLSSIDHQRRFWDWHWEHWQEEKVLSDWALRRGEILVALLRSLPVVRPRILDFGCGMGWFTEKYAALGPTTGIDLSTEGIALAQARCPHVTFIAGSVYDVALPAAHFDIVVSQEVFPRVADQPRYLERAAQVLRPGGYLVLTAANKFVMNRLGASLGFAPRPPGLIEQWVTRRGLRRMLRPWFDVIRMTTLLPIGNAGILRLVNSGKLNRLVGTVIPRRYVERLKEWAGLGYSVLAVAQKRS
jgi:2-polyprenyl-3-methyl-5-hydroxy-6-metoxy-1,4-benzoquinol methylase